MKILYFTDLHYSKYSSIVRSIDSDTGMSTRLKACVSTLNWLEYLAVERGCALTVCGGDFFDKPELNAAELTALKQVKWNSIEKIFLVGNHEMEDTKLSINSANILDLIPNSSVVSDIGIKGYGEDFILGFLPYTLESDRVSRGITVKNCFSGLGRKTIIFSHNDIKGIQLGPWLTQTGLDIDDIKDNCNLFINGHIHNCGIVYKDDNCEILNAGNIVGQTFNEEAEVYKHYAYIIDTDTLTYEAIENPFAFNFVKVKVEKSCDLISLDSELTNIPNIVISITCKESLLADTREWLEGLSSIVASRVMIEPDISNDQAKENVEDLSIDHLNKFREFILDKLGSTEVVLKEIEEVTK